MALWVLLAVSLVVFVGLSFTDPFRIGSYRLASGGFKDVLTARTQPEIPEEKVEEPDTLVINPRPEKLPPDSTIRNLLIFGDSMTHNLGMSLARYGTKNDFKVTSVTWESSSIIGWSESEKLDSFLRVSKPDYVIISLGSNELELKNFESREKYIRQLINRLGDRPFIWVGPPLWKEDKGLYKVIEKTIGKERFFPTEGFEIPRGGDHIHPTQKGADIWADSLMNWISWSNHPIRSERPDTGTSIRGHNIIYLHPDD